ncbi:MAG: hypothetical protein WCH11_00180 [Bdellovibrio sp.]
MREFYRLRDVILALCLASQTFFAPLSEASENPKDLQDKKPPSGWVEVEPAIDYDRSYVYRRHPWGFVFSLQTESGKLSDQFISPVGSLAYTQMIDRPLQIFEIQMSAKWNLSWVSILLGGGLGGGSQRGDKSGAMYWLELEKKSFHLLCAFDTLMSFPWVVPYAGLLWTGWDARTISSTERIVSANPYVLGNQAGLMFQINWFEERAARQAHAESGLENAYLDIFLAQYPGYATAGTPNIRFSSYYGLALRMEY